jgi:hypothetical protein
MLFMLFINLINIFNPQQSARPDFFVGRAEEPEKFEQNLLQTIHDSPMNMAITGQDS